MNDKTTTANMSDSASITSATDGYTYANGTKCDYRFLIKFDEADNSTNNQDAVKPYEYSQGSNNLSLHARHGSTSLSVVRNGVFDGYCKKYQNICEHTSTVLEMIIYYPEITTIHSAPCLLSLLNSTVYLFSDKKNKKGNFKNKSYCFRATQKEEFLTVQDADNDFYCDLNPTEFASFETLMHYKKEMLNEAVDGENIYLLITDRQRTSFEWVIFANHEKEINAAAFIGNGIALAELHNNALVIELRDSMYEKQFDIA